MHAALHAVAVRVLVLAVVWVLAMGTVGVMGVHGHAVRVVVSGPGAAAHHPAVVAERGEVFAQAVAGVPVAADEVGEEKEEEDGDYGVADGGAGLWRGEVLVGVAFGLGWGRTSEYHQLLQSPVS